VKTRVLLAACALAGLSVFGPPPNELASPVALENDADVALVAATVPPTPRSIAALPTVSPPLETAPPRAGYSAATLPASLPASLPARDPVVRLESLPTITPPLERVEPERLECDPAYPDRKTCIPPGPPFDQGCAITSERRFTVLPPDPQGLDHDNDGIGCEPIRGNT